MQKILYSMDDSLYSQKYDYIQNLAAAYVRKYKLASYVGDEIHIANELIHEVSLVYNIIPPRDVYATYRDLTQPPTGKLLKKAEFKIYLDQHLASRQGIYSFTESMANYYLRSLPSNPANNKESLDKINELVDSLNLTIHSIIEVEESLEDFKYKPDYISVVKAAVIYRLIKEEVIEEHLAIEGAKIIEAPDGLYIAKVVVDKVELTKLSDTKNL